MKPSVPRNLAASVADRLLERARRDGEDYQYLLLRYGVERLMYRLCQSRHAEQFIVKGAMLFLVWAGLPYRPTKDLDLLAVESASIEELAGVFRELCEVPVAGDGLVFLPESVRAEAIREDAAYQGVRVKLEARLGKVRLPLQVDIGFGDAPTPKPQTTEFPPLLEFPAPRLPMYARETAIAEKFEAMVKLGLANSRMKDFYDIWVLSREFEFESTLLARAIAATFRRRKTALPSGTPTALSATFSGDPLKQQQWAAFLRRSRLRLPAGNLEQVVEAIREFLSEPLLAVARRDASKAHWQKGGPWKPAT